MGVERFYFRVSSVPLGFAVQPPCGGRRGLLLASVRGQMGVHRFGERWAIGGSGRLVGLRRLAPNRNGFALDVGLRKDREALEDVWVGSAAGDVQGGAE